MVIRSALPAARCLMSGAMLAIVWGSAALAQAQSAIGPGPRPTSDEYQPIEVVGLGKPARLSARDLKRTYEAYLKWRPALAPAAKLYLVSAPRAQGQDLSGVKLRVVDERADSAADVAMEPDGRAAFPELDFVSGRYSILANRKARTLRIGIEALSPGTDSTHRRFGDLRLQCRIWWAVEAPGVPLPLRTMFEMARAPCASTKIPLFIRSDRPIARVEVVAGSRRWPVLVRKQVSYALPLHNKSIPASATLEITYAN